MIDNTSIKKNLVAKFEPYRLSMGQEGYSIKLIDRSTDRVIGGACNVPGLVDVGLMPYYSIIHNWLEIVSKYGEDVELDLSDTPELTEDAIKKGAFSHEYIIVVKEKLGRNGYQSVILKNKYSSLPLYDIFQSKGIFWDEKEGKAFAEKWMESIKKRFSGVFSLDITKAPLIGKYFKDII